jgi:hypothetical protein
MDIRSKILSNGDFSRTIPSLLWLVFRFARMRKSRYEVKWENRDAHAKVGGGGGDYCWLVTKGSVSLKMLSLYRVVA